MAQRAVETAAFRGRNRIGELQAAGSVCRQPGLPRFEIRRDLNFVGGAFAAKQPELESGWPAPLRSQLRQLGDFNLMQLRPIWVCSPVASHIKRRAVVREGARVSSV